MKKLFLLMVILSLKLTVFSAPVTVTTIDTNIAPIPLPVGKLIVKDLVKGDSAKAELKIYHMRDSLLVLSNVKKDSMIVNLQDQISTFRSLYETEKVKGQYKDTIIASKSTEADLYKKEAKKQKRAKHASQGLLGFGIATLIALAFIF